MTAQFESLSDRRIFVQDFGLDVLFRGDVIGIRTVRGIFDNDYEGIVGESVEYATQVPRLMCVSEDIEDVRYGDTAEVDGVTYKVRTIMANGTGITELMMEKQGA